MKRILWVFAATVICGACLFSSCKKDEETGNSDLRVAEKIIGKWMPADIDGQPVLTDKKSVYTFVSASKAYMSVSTNPQQGEGTVWNDQKELDVTISGNTMTLTNHSDDHTTMVEEFTVTAINGSEFTANHKLTVKVDGSVVLSNEGVIRFVKTTADYSAAILGLWECQGITGGETNNDDNAHLEFLADGTYRFYRRSDTRRQQRRHDAHARPGRRRGLMTLPAAETRNGTRKRPCNDARPFFGFRWYAVGSADNALCNVATSESRASSLVLPEVAEAERRASSLTLPK